MLAENSCRSNTLEIELNQEPMQIARSLILIGAFAALGGCSGTFPPRSEVPVTEAQIAELPVGIDGAQLLQKLGPPAEAFAYKNLNDSGLSWRLVEPGNQRYLFNAHFDSSGHVSHYSRTIDPAANASGSSLGG
jgi:hypothetical protein